MNTIEITLFIIFSGLAAAFFLRRYGFTYTALPPVLASVMVAYLVLDHATQVLTVDEGYNYRQVVSSATDRLRHWESGQSRTTIIFLGSLIHGFRIISSFSYESYIITAKAIQALWALLALFLGMGWLKKYFTSGKNDGVFETLFLSLCGMLPVYLMSAKMITYDLNSLLFGTSAIMMIVAGTFKANRGMLLMSIGISYLAAQEKLLMSPVIWLSIIALGIFYTRRYYSRTIFGEIRQFFTGAGVAFLLAILMNFISYLLVFINRLGRLPEGITDVYVATAPLFSFQRYFFYLIHCTHWNELLKEYSQEHPWLWPLGMGSSSLLALLLAGCGYVIARRLGKRVGGVISSRQIWGGFHGRTGSHFSAVIFLSLILIFWLVIIFTSGQLPGLRVKPYLLPQSTYRPIASFNDTYVLYGAESYGGHLFYHTAWSYFRFFTEFPSVTFIAVVMLLFFYLKQRYNSRAILDQWKFLDWIMYACFSAPLIYGIAAIPVGFRYLSIFALLFSIVLVIRLAYVFNTFSHRTGVLLLIIFCLAPFWEMASLSPIFGQYRPFWNISPQEANYKPDGSRIEYVWSELGEEAMLAGKWVAKNINSDSPKRIWFNYNAEWLGKPNNFKIIWMLGKGEGDWLYTEDDFYVINRVGMYHQCGSIPHAIEPVMKIAYRGFTQAWVFRGDNLRDGGFKLDSYCGEKRPE